jgi:hypothetical protein
MAVGGCGEVVEVGLRTVRIAPLDDNLVSIPNNPFPSGAVSFADAGALDPMCVFSFYIGSTENADLSTWIECGVTATRPLRVPREAHLRPGSRQTCTRGRDRVAGKAGADAASCAGHVGTRGGIAD